MECGICSGELEFIEFVGKLALLRCLDCGSEFIIPASELGTLVELEAVGYEI